MRSCGSLPPSVEGKIHGYLKLVIDAIAWSRGNPGKVSVFPSWWGEPSSVRFRPVNVVEYDVSPDDQSTHVYAIKTNLNLFKEYVRNCETVELVVTDKGNNAIGSAEVTDLLEIFEGTCVSKYVPVMSPNVERIGEIRVSLSLLSRIPQDSRVAPSKSEKCEINGFTHSHSSRNITEFEHDHFLKRKDEYKRKTPYAYSSNMYKSILKEKKYAVVDDIADFESRETGKLVAQAIAKAQRLRGALKEVQTKYHVGSFDNNSFDEDSDLPRSVENEAKLYQYILGKNMTVDQEKAALHTLKSISPASSLVQFASESLDRCKSQGLEEASNKDYIGKQSLEIRESNCHRSKEPLLLDHIDAIKIDIRSFNLSSAGYRRVKSSCVLYSDNMPLHVSYFVHYDIGLLHPKLSKDKQSKHTLIKLCSKSQADTVVTFNHSGTYNISITKLHSDYALKFKVLTRHLNQKSPTALGTGSMYVKDIMKTDSWSITQDIAIMNKGMKVGELNVTAQLGSDFSHFGKEYADALMPNKKNIPSFNSECLLSKDSNKVTRMKGRCLKTYDHEAVDSERDCSSSKHDTKLFNPRYQRCHKDENTVGTQLYLKHQDNIIEEEISLHGLIYISEGKHLPVTNTYLICKTCWKDDNTMSYIVENTENPVYDFRQVNRFHYGTDLLDRVKNNYIIIEVHNKRNGMEELLGLAKLPVHQFYLAYNNPQILPRLLSSKYPVVSVDGWVPVVDPITGRSCGELFALVALGTISQIGALEALRGHDNIATKEGKKIEHVFVHPSPNLQVQDLPKENTRAFYVNHVPPREETASAGSKTQAIQTDISMLSERKKEKPETSTDTDHTALHRLVDRLNKVLVSEKSNVHRSAQTEPDLRTTHSIVDELSGTDVNLNNVSDDSDSIHFQLPTEAYRSVGVGAEYDEDFQQQTRSVNCNNTQSSSSARQFSPQKFTTDYHLDTFRAVIEIVSALHLTKIERSHDIVEPSTYVTFQAQKCSPDNCFKSYISTNIASYTCNPKWNWKADVRLPTELLVNNGKRLILKVWHVNDPESGTQVDLERDIVLGFAAIDLTVLLNGFPMISGWFHIMDFAGKCNGQIQVKVTPLENLSSFVKTSSTARNTRSQIHSSPHSDWIIPNSLNNHQIIMEQNHKHPLPVTANNEESSRDVNTPHISTMNGGMHFLENESMSFLSLSLKQKLTELDEITKRLQSRLHDVTSSAFEEDFENDFELNEAVCYNENSETVNNDAKILQREQISQISKNVQTVDNGNHSEKHITQNNIHSIGFNTINNRAETSVASSSNNHVESTENGLRLQHEYHSAQHYNQPTVDNMNDYPARGAKVHINHLLDKLSLQPTARPLSSGSIPLGRNIIELLQNLHQSNNNVEHSNKCRTDVAVCTVPTQTDNSDDENSEHFASGLTDHCMPSDGNINEPQINNKVSETVRDELMADEDSDAFKTDELSTYLMASNVRHMDFDHVVNPLVYSHLIPDLENSIAVSNEGDPAEHLDNYYSKVFGASIETLKKETKSTTVTSLVSNENNSPVESAKNAKHFRISPSGVSTQVEGNINLNDVHKSCYDDLLATNNVRESLMSQVPAIISESASHSAGTSESSLSRQAPEGGNPIEDDPSVLIKQRQSNSRDSPATS